MQIELTQLSMKLGYHFDGESNIKVFSDDVHVATLSVVSGTNLVTDEDMSPIVAVLSLIHI